jgi:hypothetical protein
MSFFFGAISGYPLQSFFVPLEKNETKKGFSLLSGLGCSGIENSKYYFCFKNVLD